MNTTEIDILIQQNYFSKFELIESRLSIADLFKPERRCGIYVLRFKDGQYYVGQAIDVTRRYIQHFKNHNDIQEIAFRILPKEKLNEIEQGTIKVLESAGAKLRNIFFTSYPVGESDLDLIVSRQKQEDFLRADYSQRLQPPIIDNPDIQSKYTNKFKRLLKHQHFETSVLPFLHLYLTKCIIKPERTELSFWSLTCLTKAFLDNSLISLCRLNVFCCEVMTIWIDFNGEIVYTFHLAKSYLPKPIIKSIRKSLKLETLQSFNHFYERAGEDQFMIDVRGIDQAIKLLSDDKVVTAIKTFNLRQMQKGPTIYSRYHSLDLTRYLFTVSNL